VKFRKYLKNKYDTKEKMDDFLKGYEEFKLGIILKDKREKEVMEEDSKIVELFISGAIIALIIVFGVNFISTAKIIEMPISKPISKTIKGG